jgi:RHS repeat-associated protein
VHVPLAAGAGCADGLPCSGTAVCDGHGACIPVDDGNSCTLDVCDPGRGLSHVPVAAGTPCSTSASCPGPATCDGAGTCSACTVGKLKFFYGENEIPNGGPVTVPAVLAGSRGVVIPLTVSNLGNGDVILSGTPNVTITGPNAADFSIQEFPPSTIASGKSEPIQLKFAPSVAGTRTASLQVISNDTSNSPFVIALTATGLAASDLNPATNGNLADHTEALCNTREARLMIRTGDIDNLGFGWPTGFDPFSGLNTPAHSYPWPVDPNDPAGTDRISIGSSFAGGCNDGYCNSTTRPGNLPQCISLNMQAECVDGTVPSSGLIQVFVDDFQPRAWGSLFQVTINGKRATQIENGINLLNQTGPIGKLMTFTLTPDQLALLKPGAVSLCFDDPTTGKGDGFAVDFVKLLVDVYGTDKKGTIRGKVTDAHTGTPIAGAAVSAGGVVTSLSDAGGNYTLASVPAGFVYLFANASGYQTNGQVIDLPDGQTDTVNIAMSPNAPPVITSTPVTQVLVGSTYSYKVVATDADNDTLAWGIPHGAPAGLTINEFTGQITWSPTADQIGSWPITVEVDDRRGGVATQSFTISVGAANRPPTVACQQDLHLIGSSAAVSISCPVSDDGKLDVTPTLGWSFSFKGTAPPTLTPTGDSAEAVLSAPGIYEFTLTADDGEFQVPGSVIVTLSPSENALLTAFAGPDQAITDLTTSLTGTAIGGSGALLVSWTQLDGPAAAQIATPADASTSVTFTAIGTYDFRFTATDGQSIDSDDVKVIVVPTSGTGASGTQGWIGEPLSQTTVNGLVPVTVAAGVTVTSGTLSYWPATNPDDTHVLTAAAAGGPGTTLATLDTTVLRNGTYVIDLTATDGHGNQLESDILVTVDGDYKPGREVVEVTDFTVPIAGLPITIGRRYDSLEREIVGDFGNGWSLTVGHPDLKVDLANNVTITLPNGRRATFSFELMPPVVGPVIFGFLGLPTYVPAPGVFGKLTSDGCPLLSFDPNNPDPVCFGAIDGNFRYAPTTYRYTDPYGVVYTMGTDGTLKSIQDRNNNVLTFTPGGIVSEPSGQTVSFTRDAQGRITKIVTPAQFEYDYTYDANGNLASAKQPPQNTFTQVFKYTYDADHRLLTTIDPAAHQTSSTYDTAGRLASSTDAMANATRYAYDIPGHRTTTTYPDTGVTTETFDENGMLLSETDQLDRTTTHQYDANRNEIKRTNALGEATTFTYDANGNRTSSTNGRGERTTATYNAFSERLTRTDPIGNTTTGSFDDTGTPKSLSDSMGPLATFTSSAQGLPIAATDAAGNEVFMSYDDSGDLTGRTDRLGRQTAFSYDAMGRKTSMVDPRGGVTSYSYDQDGDLTFTQNPLGFGPLVRYDAARNVQQIQDVNGSTFRGDEFTYDANNHLTATLHDDDRSQVRQTVDFRGNVLTKTDEVGNTTSYTYDLAGRLVRTTYADGTFTTQSYDALGRLELRTDERGNTTRYAYEPGCDCADRLISVTDPLGRTTSMTYDGMSRKTSMTDANGNKTVYVYDLRGHLIETDYADGSATHDTYDALGRRTANTDQTGAKTQFAYDAEGQLTSVTDPLGNVTRYGYDANGNLVSVTDANNHVTTYTYDAANRKISRTLPLGMTEMFGYDGDGNAISHTDFRGKTSGYVYDGRRRGGRLVSKVPDPSLGEPTVKYVYKANGARSSMTDASGTTTYSYDRRNRLLTKVTPQGTLTYGYDPSGNVASILSSNTNGNSVTYAWDAANQLNSETDNRLGGMTTEAYTATGQQLTVSQPNGVGVTYEHDALDRVTSMAWRKGTNRAFASWGYTYSPRGQRLTSTEATGREAGYAYDEAARLISETVSGDPRGPSGNGALTYVLDAVGNRLFRASTLAALDAQSMSYDANDELTSDGYDPNGNTTTSGGHTYGYDFENRLVSKDGGAVTVLYNGDGDRVAKTAGGITTQYLVDELNPSGRVQVLEELVGGVVNTRYTHGTRLVSQTRNVSTTPTTSYYGYDAHGNVTFLTDTSGSLTDSYDYDAWGVLVSSTGNTPNSRLYAGEERDPDLGLINLRARQYQAGTGRFLTIDPMTGSPDNPITFDRYLYGNADPVNRVDPSGHDAAAEEGVILKGLTYALMSQLFASFSHPKPGQVLCQRWIGITYGFMFSPAGFMAGLVAQLVINLLCLGL